MIKKNRQGKKMSMGWKKSKFLTNHKKISKEFMVKSWDKRVLLIKQKKKRMALGLG